MKQNNDAFSVTDPKNGLTYTLHGDYYFLDLMLSDKEKKPIGHYGQMRLKYLQEHRPGLYSRLHLSGKLYEHLAEIDKACHERLDVIIPAMAKAEGINEALKASDQMTWVASMNSIRQRVEEMLLSELVYT